MFCGVYSSRNLLLRPGLCPFCLGDKTKTSEWQFQHWCRKDEQLRHLESHLQEVPIDGEAKCRHPKCRSVHPGREALRRHFEAVHHITPSRANGSSNKRKSDDGVAVAENGDKDAECVIFGSEDLVAEPGLFVTDPQLLIGDEEGVLVSGEDSVTESDLSVIDPQLLAGDGSEKSTIVSMEDVIAEPSLSVIDPQLLIVDPMLEFFCLDEAAACQQDSDILAVAAEENQENEIITMAAPGAQEDPDTTVVVAEENQDENKTITIATKGAQDDASSTVVVAKENQEISETLIVVVEEKVTKKSRTKRNRTAPARQEDSDTIIVVAENKGTKRRRRA